MHTMAMIGRPIICLGPVIAWCDSPLAVMAMPGEKQYVGKLMSRNAMTDSVQPNTTRLADESATPCGSSGCNTFRASGRRIAGKALA
jgi:hypothetical protein